MDNWDFKWQHPVITRKTPSPSPLKFFMGMAQATAASPDTVKSSSDPANTTFKSEAATFDTFSDVSKVVLKLASPLRARSGYPYDVLLKLYSDATWRPGGQVTYAAAPLRGHTVTMRLQEITADFDLDADTTWNALSGLTFGSNIDSLYSCDHNVAQLVYDEKIVMPLKTLSTRVPSSNVNVYGFVLTVKIGHYTSGSGTPTAASASITLQTPPDPPTSYALDYQA